MLVGLTRRRADPVTGAAAFTADHVISRPYPDAHLGDARALMVAIAGTVPHALGRDRLAVPGIEACDRCIAALMACVVLALPCSTCPIVPPVMIVQYNRSHHTPGLNT